MTFPPIREIRADYDEETIVVYQAFRPDIAIPAARHGRLVAPFSRSRMTWVKPSFLWMMERCGWGTKPNQEHVLLVRLSRAGWETALRKAIPSDVRARRPLARVQWDPERDIQGGLLPYRSIQLGLGRSLVPDYVDRWTRDVRDLSGMVARMRELRAAGLLAEALELLPKERPYPTPADIRVRLGMEAPGTA